jgi:ABC-2 type transport system ATP-binding protein
MSQIEVESLAKTYVTYQRGSGFGAIAKSVFKREFQEVRALKGVSFDIDEGSLVGFLGPNGAGKSTTLKILTGVLHPSSGRASVLGFCPWQKRKRYVANIGAVFGQKSQLIWDIPPLDSFLMNQAIYGIGDEPFRARLDHFGGMLGVADLMRQPTRNLSLGERMKCEFIMAMLHGPRIVFLDEPTIGLDLIAKETIRGFIREMNARGVTFILTTHDLADVEALARRVIVINSGDLVFDDGLEKLRAHFGSRKRIRLVSRAPIGELGLEGLEETSRAGDRDISYELDLGVCPLDRFIARANERAQIQDMSIEEIPIERVIRELYETEAAPAATLRRSS